MNNKEKEVKYKQLCYKYGVITLCFLIDEYAKQEEYEECQIILNAINQLSEKWGEIYPTTYDDYSKRWFERNIRKITGTDGYFIIDNMPYYIEQVKKDMSNVK
jgi:hypothetical protein